jgi:hypothetical protein
MVVKPEPAMIVSLMLSVTNRAPNPLTMDAVWPVNVTFAEELHRQSIDAPVSTALSRQRRSRQSVRNVPDGDVQRLSLPKIVSLRQRGATAVTNRYFAATTQGPAADAI